MSVRSIIDSSTGKINASFLPSIQPQPSEKPKTNYIYYDPPFNNQNSHCYISSVIETESRNALIFILDDKLIDITNLDMTAPYYNINYNGVLEINCSLDTQNENPYLNLINNMSCQIGTITNINVDLADITTGIYNRDGGFSNITTTYAKYEDEQRQVFNFQINAVDSVSSLAMPSFLSNLPAVLIGGANLDLNLTTDGWFIPQNYADINAYEGGNYTFNGLITITPSF